VVDVLKIVVVSLDVSVDLLVEPVVSNNVPLLVAVKNVVL
jgi:hypothetical protein